MLRPEMRLAAKYSVVRWILLLVLGSLRAQEAPDPARNATASPLEESRENAIRAVDDLLRHWWIGDESTGHLTPTHGGCPTNNLGVLWERAVVICALDGLCGAMDDPHLRQRIRAQWIHERETFRPAELEACGSGTHSPWCDDAAWSLLYYVIVFQRTGEADALERAKGMAQNIHTRWSDDELGGGLWYNDKRQIKSLYAVAYVYGCLGVYEATHDSKYRDLALTEYQWIETHLLRPDNLYWCDYSAGPPADAQRPRGPVGADRPQQIRAGGSVVYLGGNMGMGACQAYLYQLTGDDAYRQAAFRTAAALSTHLKNAQGCYINDRDAFNNGIFASLWARRLITLPGFDPEPLAVLRVTAKAVAASRTTPAYVPAYGPGGEGFYPGDWDGGSHWETSGSMANMMHVSASSIGIIVAAAYDYLPVLPGK